MQLRIHLYAALLINVLNISSALGASNCPFDYGPHAAAKPNKLFLFFPTIELPDPSPPFPSVGYNNVTRWLPLPPFDPGSGLPAYKGTEAELRDAIHNVVAGIYCEFNVHVAQTSTLPTIADGPRRNTIGISTDVAANRDCTNPLRGQSKVEGGDTGDLNHVDFARVWAGAFQQCATGVGGALRDGNSTTERWANSIGSTIAHEAGHNYGLSHLDGGPHRPGEDSWSHHLMRAGTGSYTWHHRAKRRHFSDHEYSVLAANVGLAMGTMWNWDFINPNAPIVPNAAKLRMELLSTNPSLILSWSYSGGQSPWINPTLTGPSGTRTFKGTTYNVYNIEWSTAQMWSHGPSGQVPSQSKFHVGATFSSTSQIEPDSVIIFDVKLYDASNNALPEHPRWVGFDAATFDRRTGLLSLRLHNVAAHPLVLRNVIVRHMPRIVSLDAMMADEPISDISGRVFQPWSDGTRVLTKQQTMKAGGDISIPVGNIGSRPYVFQRPTGRDCAPVEKSEYSEANCQAGKVVVDLFPATTIYVTATIVDPRGQRWDPKAKRLVVGPVETGLYYQIAGRPRL
ncbi:MAG: hypothetical protein K2Y71_20055 [Xanthobacteraceae bacterium]|nr:hypothetical protein [Xanthobacteraceae bacterium]